ncbi:MAG: DUF4398 domain-containing protein [Proteobacteria bacterium]|nr:DUF4398 domain-containing protein [Pseudomonadota bacterium]MBU4470359.1 DUF4398 domain-containing protein [Pseudomonadota bacterium]MCG2752770.1 DUF4398 domain-containing protein [Desulfobacteraceae bacterium]
MKYKTTKRKWIPSLFFIPIVMLLIVGCATPGSRSIATMKISESEKALSIARETNASPSTFVDLTMAENELAQANQALAANDYLKATRLAEKATVDSDCARIEAKAAQAKKDEESMRQNNQKMKQHSGIMSQ